jgi:hypothetical protein
VKSDAFTGAVFFNELDAASLERGADFPYRISSSTQFAVSRLEPRDCRFRNARMSRQVRLGPTKQRAGRATKFAQDTPSLGIQMQRPICVYPQIALYDGKPDPADELQLRALMDPERPGFADQCGRIGTLQRLLQVIARRGIASAH